MEPEPGKSDPRPQGWPGHCEGSAAAWCGERPRGMRRRTGDRRASDCASVLGGLRAFRDDADDTPSNHSVEANRRPAAPLEAGSQFGSRFSARPYSPAAVAHLWRSITA